MVWFQCDDCGDDLKKPKLPNHFRVCSASKLSCIDCGEEFGQHDVESHTQCITEAEFNVRRKQSILEHLLKKEIAGHQLTEQETDIKIRLLNELSN